MQNIWRVKYLKWKHFMVINVFGKCRKILIFTMIQISPWNSEKQVHIGQGKSSHGSCSIKVGFLKNFTISTGNHLCWSLFLIKLQVLRPATLLIYVFSYEYCEILKISVLKIICVWLLLTRHRKTICFLFLRKCLLPKLNFRFLLKF